MNQYSDQEVDEKIQEFWTKKLQKYPELAQISDKKSGTFSIGHTVKFIQSLTSYRHAASH